MAHAISMAEGRIRATLDQRLEDLKARNLPTSDNQQPFGDGDLNKIMDRDLYVATKEGDVEKFIGALEKVSESRKLALSLIFDQVTPSGNSLLHVAASFGSEHVMELILIHFPSLMTRNNPSEDTPLHVAIKDGSLKAIEKLISLDKNSEIIYRKNKDSKSPLYLAIESWDGRIFQLVLDAYAGDQAYADKIEGISPVFAAIKERERGMLEAIVERLPKLLNVRDEDGGTPLHCAASVGSWLAGELLLEKCPYMALQTDKKGSYPIHIACEVRRYSSVKRLMEYTWPDPAEIKNSEGQNILHVAAKAGNNSVLSRMSDLCDDAVIKKLANSKDVHGNTPLHLASMHNHCQALLCLTRDKRSNLRLRNNKELTALDVAVKSESLSTRYSALLGRAILISAGVPQSEGQDVRSLKERTELMKGQVETRLLVATLVATVTFAAGFTLPGGYNASSDPHPGTAIMLHNIVFQVFVIANMLAMYSSILAVVILLWGHFTDFYVAEQATLIAGPLLLTALTGMAVAFMAGVIVAVRELNWLAHLVLSIGVFFLMMLIMVLAALIFPSSKTAMAIVALPYLYWTLLADALRPAKPVVVFAVFSGVMTVYMVEDN